MKTNKKLFTEINEHEKKKEAVVVCLSGRGDKDLETYMQHIS